MVVIIDVDDFLSKKDFRKLKYSKWPWIITHFCLAKKCHGCDFNVSNDTSSKPLHFILAEEKIIKLLSLDFFWCQNCKQYAIYDHYPTDEFTVKIMPYKIVQTIERGKALLVAVPQQWEQDGVLYWPRKNSEKLQRNEISKPEENWSTKNCILKRNNILSLQKAESIIDLMCQNSDTETEPDIGQHLGHYQYKAKSFNKEQVNFNHMAEEVSQNYNKRILNSDGITEQPTSYDFQHTSYDNQESVIIAQEAIPVSAETQSPIILQQIEDSRVTNNVLPKIDEISESLKTVIASINTNNENQQILFQTQNNILSKLSEMHTQFEEILKQSFKSADKSQSSDIKPISSLKEFQEFETLVSTNDPVIMSELKNKLSVVCSKGKGKGYNNAYILIDVLFERNFLRDCSWAGGSKSDKTKICFKSFTNTIKLFFNVIHASDGDFTLVDCHKFLKIILRNALQRSNNKQLRLSTKKNRQKYFKNTPQTQSDESAENKLDQPQPKAMEVADAVNLPCCFTDGDE